MIFCGSDLIAMGAMLALEASGIDVPRDISVVGIDNISFSFMARPPLTTINVPREQLGATSFQALDEMLNLKRQRGNQYVLERELVIRKSTGIARQNGCGVLLVETRSETAEDESAARRLNPEFGWIGCMSRRAQGSNGLQTLRIHAERQTTATKAQTTPTPCSRVMDSCRTNGASTMTTSG